MTAGPRRVLLVEDEWIIAAATQDALEDAGLAVVGPAATVAEALALIRDDAPLDAAVIDVQLKGEMSFPVAEALRERGIPFVFVTGFTAADMPERFRTCRVFDKLTRPAVLLAGLGLA